MYTLFDILTEKYGKMSCNIMVVSCVCQDLNLRFLLSQLLNDIESDIVLVC